MATKSPLHETQTFQNLLEAFKEETSCGFKYSRYARAAREGGHAEIADLFSDTASKEYEHAESILSFLDGKTSAENLREALEEEEAAAGTRYPDYEMTARSEGLPEVAHFFKTAAMEEKRHEAQFRAALEEATRKNDDPLTFPALLALFRTAIDEEIKAQEFYRTLAERSPHPEARKMLLKIIEDEKRHEQALIERYKRMKTELSGKKKQSM